MKSLVFVSGLLLAGLTWAKTPTVSKEKEPSTIAYTGSSLQSLAIDQAVSFFNSQLNITNLDKKISDKIHAPFYRQIDEYQKVGVMKDVPVKAFVIPHAGVNLILGRDIVTRPVKGNRLQLHKADSFGLSFSAGTYLGLAGISKDILPSLDTKLYINRVYTHYRPLTKVSAIFKVPYHNMLVIPQRHELMNVLERFLDQTHDPELLLKLKVELDKSLPVGDSLVMTDTLGKSVAAGLAGTVAPHTTIGAQVALDSKLMRRININRVSDNEVQVYVENGSVGNKSIKLDLSVVAPMLTFETEVNDAKAKTKLYQVDFGSQDDLAKNLSFLREALKFGKVREEKKTSQLTVNTTAVTQRSRAHLLPINIGTEKLRYLFKVQTEDGRSQSMIRVSRVRHLDWDGLPITSFDAKNFEADLDAMMDDETKTLSKFFYTSTRTTHDNFGTKKNLKRRIQDLDKKLGSASFDPETVKNLKSVQSSITSYQVKINDEGIMRLAHLSEEDILKALSERENLSAKLAKNFKKSRAEDIAREVSRLIRKFQQLSEKKDEKAASYLLESLKLLDKSLSIKGLETLVGSKNVMGLAQIQGFISQLGKSIYTEIKGNTYGNQDMQNECSPIAAIMKEHDISDYEFLSQWLIKTYGTQVR